MFGDIPEGSGNDTDKEQEHCQVQDPDQCRRFLGSQSVSVGEKRREKHSSSLTFSKSNQIMMHFISMCITYIVLILSLKRAKGKVSKDCLLCRSQVDHPRCLTEDTHSSDTS